MPNEVPDPVRFDQDEAHCAYDRVLRESFLARPRAGGPGLQGVSRPLRRQVQPVHLFWGAPDLAVTRFSGRTAPEHPGGIPNLPDRVTREAYSHEVSELRVLARGRQHRVSRVLCVRVSGACRIRDCDREAGRSVLQPDYGEFVLPYDVVRGSPSPDATLLEFLQTTYEAAANWESGTAGPWKESTIPGSTLERPSCRRMRA